MKAPKDYKADFSKTVIEKSFPILISWNILSVLEVLFHLVLGNGIFFKGNLPFIELLSALFKGLLLLFGMVIVIGLLFFQIKRLIGVRASGIVFPLLLWPLMMLYLSSWYVFKINGRFYSSGAFLMLFQDTVQLYQHIIHTMSFWALLVPLFVLFLLFFMGKVLRIAQNRIQQIFVKKYVYVNFFIFLFIIVFSSSVDYRASRDNTLVFDSSSQIARKESDIYTEVRDFNTNPIATLIADVYFKAFPMDMELQGEMPFSVERHPIISMEKYVQKENTYNMKRLNVILLLVESLRTDQLRTFGGDNLVMENLEDLSRRSIRFVDNYTQASHSDYADPCTLSSHYPLRSRFYHSYPKDAPYPKILIYDILKNMGYRTAIISSQNENWGKMSNYLQTGNINHFFHSETFKGDKYVPESDTGFARFIKRTKMSGKIDDKYTVAEALRWIDQGGDQPFFIYMNLQNSHIPYPIPKNFPKKFGPKKADFTIRFADLPRDKVELVKGMYSDSLRYVDYQFGRVIKHLEEKNLLEKTIIIVTGDTGQAFYEHGFASHASFIYDEVMRVPLFIYVPGAQPRTDKRPAQHIDIPPTILSLLNLPPHPSFQGIDLTSAEVSPDRSRFIMAQTPLAHQYGIVKNNFKLIYTPQTHEIRLFDLKEDPGETKNLADIMPGKVQRLLPHLKAWISLQLTYYEKASFFTRTYPPYLIS